MKLGCSSWSYHAAFRAGSLDLREWLRICAEDLDVDGIELVDQHFPTSDPLYLRDLKKLCTDLQLTISGIAVSNDFGADDRRQEEIEKVQRWCEVAAYIGAPIVRVFAGWVPRPRVEPHPGRIVGTLRRVLGPKPVNILRTWSDATAAMRQCADYAAERGVVLAVQNNSSGGVVGTIPRIEQCLRDVGSPWLAVCLDLGDLPGAIDFGAIAPRIVQAHARVRDVADDGSETRVHWPELLRQLQLARYRGFVHVDYEGVEDPASAVPRATRYLRGLLHLLSRQQLLAAPAASDNRTDFESREDEERAERYRTASVENPRGHI